MKNLNWLLLFGMGIVLMIAAFLHKISIEEEQKKIGQKQEISVPAEPAAVEKKIKAESICQCNLWLVILSTGIGVILCSVRMLYKQRIAGNKNTPE